MLRRRESKPPSAARRSAGACLSPGCGRRKQRLEKMKLLESGLLENVREDPRLAMVSPRHPAARDLNAMLRKCCRATTHYWVIYL